MAPRNSPALIVCPDQSLTKSSPWEAWSWCKLMMDFRVEQLGSLINYTPCSWQSARHDYRRCSYFCFIKLTILPERAVSLFFSYHVHSHNDRRAYSSQEVNDLSRSILQSGQIPFRKSISKFPGSMLFSTSESSDHLANISFLWYSPRFLLQKI